MWTHIFGSFNADIHSGPILGKLRSRSTGAMQFFNSLSLMIHDSAALLQTAYKTAEPQNCADTLSGFGLYS